MLEWIGNIPFHIWTVLGVSALGMVMGLIYDSDGALALSLLFGVVALPIAVLIAIFSFAAVVSYGVMAIFVAVMAFFVLGILWVIITSLIDLASY